MSESKINCSICEEGRLAVATHDLEIKHGDKTLLVRALEHSVCDVCGEEPVLTEQIRRNQLRIADAKRESDGLLTGAGVRSIREHLGLTQQEAAVVFGGGANAFSKYERGDVSQSVAMDRLLKAASFVPGVLEFLRWESDTTLNGGPCPAASLYQISATRVSEKGFTSRSVKGKIVVLGKTAWHAEAA